MGSGNGCRSLAAPERLHRHISSQACVLCQARFGLGAVASLREHNHKGKSSFWITVDASRYSAPSSRRGSETTSAERRCETDVVARKRHKTSASLIDASVSIEACPVDNRARTNYAYFICRLFAILAAFPLPCKPYFWSE